MNTSTDYTIRDVRRGDDSRVTYTVCDMAGQVRHVTVPYPSSTPELADPIIRWFIALTRPTLVAAR